MGERLVEAARVGDVMTLHRIMAEDPEMLEQESSVHFADSALHVAARRGKAEFVKHIVTGMPWLATETNQQGMIPLHLASLKGHVETVRELLKAKKLDDGVKQCVVKDEEGWTPLHCASQKGKISVIEELIRACPQSLEEVTAKGETVVHIAVKANQYGAVKVLADSIRRHNLQILFKAQDQKGKTAYQLAAAKKQSQVVEVLKEEEEIREEHGINVEIESESESEGGGRKDGRSKEGDSESQLNAILVVAALIITLTYQSMTDPPSSFFSESGGKTALGTPGPVLGFLFMIFNSCVFLQSIYVVFTTLRGSTVLFPVRALTLFLMLCYSILLANFCSVAHYPSVVPYVVLCVALLASCILARQNFFIGCMTRCPRRQPRAS